jgi:hypothetical protein
VNLKGNLNQKAWLLAGVWRLEKGFIQRILPRIPGSVSVSLTDVRQRVPTLQICGQEEGTRCSVSALVSPTTRNDEHVLAEANFSISLL